MHVTITPPSASGRPAFPLTITGEPTLEWARGVGCSKADIPCSLTDSQREYIRGSAVAVYDPDWFGVVWEVPGEDGVLHVIGWQAWASMSKREAAYLLTDASKWTAHQAYASSPLIAPKCDNGQVAFVYEAGAMSGLTHGAFLHVPTTGSCRLEFAWSIPNTAVGINVYTGAHEAVGVDGDAHAWTLETAAHAAGAAGTSGNYAVTLTRAVIDSVLIYITNNAWTAALGNTVVCSGVKVYGVSGVASATATNVLADALATLPAAALPSGAAYLGNIAAPAGEIADLYFGPDTTCADVVAKVAASKDHEWGWYVGRVADITRALPHFFPRPTTPAYRLDCGRIDTSGLSSEDIEPMASVIRAIYTDASGVERYVDVTDTNAANYLVRAGITKMEAVSCGTTDATGADGIADANLSEMSRDRVSGTVPADDLLTIGGAPARMDTVRCGEMVRLLNVRGRPWVDATIAAVRYAGGEWSIDVDAAYRLSTALAK
jgi:hypothetical protein